MSILNKGSQEGVLTLDAVMAEVNKAVDAKVGAKFDDFKKTSLPDVIKQHVDPLNSQLVTINEALGKLVVNQGQGVGSNSGQGGNSGQNSGINSGQGSGSGNSLPPEVNVQLRELMNTVKQQGTTITDLKSAKELAEKRAEETDRHSIIRASLNGMPFVSQSAADTAFSIVSPHVRRLEDGSLVAGIAGDNFPVSAFTKDYLEKEHGYLFKSTGTGGSGAPLNAGGVRMGTKADTNQIKIGMTEKDRAAVVESISAAIQSV